MPDEELTLILRLRDEATKQMKSARAGIAVSRGRDCGGGFHGWEEVGRCHQDHRGRNRSHWRGVGWAYRSDYQAVAKYGDGAATVIADLNTHLGLEGEELRIRSRAQALKAEALTQISLETSLSQLGLDAKGSAEFLDQLTVTAQGSGVDIEELSVDQLTMTIWT